MNDEGLTLETPASLPPQGGHFTLTKAFDAKCSSFTSSLTQHNISFKGVVVKRYEQYEFCSVSPPHLLFFPTSTLPRKKFESSNTLCTYKYVFVLEEWIQIHQLVTCLNVTFTTVQAVDFLSVIEAKAHSLANFSFLVSRFNGCCSHVLAKCQPAVVHHAFVIIRFAKAGAHIPRILFEVMPVFFKSKKKCIYFILWI